MNSSFIQILPGKEAVPICFWSDNDSLG